MNKPTKTIAALCLLNSASAHALGVGEITTYSALNQLLKAQIPLVGSKQEDPSNIKIGIASRETFDKAGIDRPHYLTQLKFTPVLGKNGEITVDVRSTATIKEPFVNFILEVEWPQGRTLKEFTILLDPPITMSDVRTNPLELPQTPSITPVTPVNDASVTTYTPPTTTVQTAPASEYGPTKSRDTIWGIAKKLITNNRTVTHQQMMLALYDNNPEAFYKENINALKKGAVLKLPSTEQAESLSPTQANNEYIKHNTLWSSSTTVSSTPAAVAKLDQKDQALAATSDVKKKLENNLDEAKLTLLTPKQDTEKNIPIEGNTTDTPIGSTSSTEQANIAIEMATTLEEENKEVKSRLNDLEKQVDKLQRLLALKDEQLAQLQAAKPVVAESTATTIKPAPIDTPVEKNDSKDNDNTLALYGGGALLVLLGLFLARRKKQRKETQPEDVFSDTPAVVPTIDTDNTDTSSTILDEEPLLSEFIPSEFDSSEHTQEADPLTECDVYIAYGRFQQAEDLIKSAIESEPENLALKLKLLDVYFSSNNAEAFEEQASSLSDLKDSDPDAWNSIVDMGMDICPDSPLFLAPAEENIEIQAAPIQTDDLDLDLDLEIQQDIEPEEANHDEEPKSEFEFDFDLIKNQDTPQDLSNPTSESIETMFSLAQASLEMEDTESARQTLEEILENGNDSDKEKAQKMLDSL
ncbi:FimV/HubP family polar landmark protein [uncultured Cycloclasticus sp.]|uniref:type IV pilus assembly protein FimV n=1 Tax=uncultured Cycloclasticus sp. TaxID=172194 RepID=UPI00258E11D7|nr:FimV/HubP family polar landmark protein [uncultured Cycloclasticus sp.]